MKNTFTILLTLLLTTTHAQHDILKNSWVKFSRDSTINDRLKSSLNNFLMEANKGNYTTKYVDQEHLKNNEYFYQEFEQITNSRYFKDSLFFKPQLLKSVKNESNDYYLTIQYIGYAEEKPITKAILNFKAKPKDNYYQFFCLFDENTANWKSTINEDITFHYSSSYNKQKADEFVNFHRKLERLTKQKSPIKNYYKCLNTQEALGLFGIEYAFRNSNSGSGFGMSDDNGNFVTGINSEDYLHDYVHSFLGRIYDSKKTWREFEEGIAIYYGKNWGVPLNELKEVLKNELKNDSNYDFLAQLKKGKKSKRYDGLHLYDRIITAIIAEKVIEKLGFDAAIDLLHSGDNGENFLELLDKKIGINEQNFNKRIKKLLLD